MGWFGRRMVMQWWLTMNDSGSSGVDVDDDTMMMLKTMAVTMKMLMMANKAPKLNARTAQKKHHLLYRKELCCMTTHALKWIHWAVWSWNSLGVFLFARANLEWGDCHGGINASKLQVYYWQRSKNSLVTVNDVGSSGDSLCIYCFLVVCLKLFLFITSPIGRYVFYLHWNMVCTRVRRAPSFQHLTRQRQITVSSQSQPLPANKQNDVDNWMMKTHIKNIIHFFVYVCISNFSLQSPIIYPSLKVYTFYTYCNLKNLFNIFLILPDSRLNFRSSPRLSVSFASSTSKGCSGDDCEVAKGGAKGGASETERGLSFCTEVRTISAPSLAFIMWSLLTEAGQW